MPRDDDKKLLAQLAGAAFPNPFLGEGLHEVVVLRLTPLRRPTLIHDLGVDLQVVSSGRYDPGAEMRALSTEAEGLEAGRPYACKVVERTTESGKVFLVYTWAPLDTH